MALSQPVLFQINTQPSLQELGALLGRPATLADVGDATLDGWAARGINWVWLLGVWQTGPLSRQECFNDPGLVEAFHHSLPDFRSFDVCGSPFAVAAYRVKSSFGGPLALAAFRQRLQRRGIHLLLDFVPNHTGLDHSWVVDHPEYYVAGTEQDLARASRNYFRPLQAPSRILAHGRDPNFPGWTDTAQLDYSNPLLVEAMRAELQRVASECDGVRCDMAMLLLPEIFERTWGRKARPFWAETIRQVRERHPGFVFMAEVYWDLEYRMQQEGFDFAYDKTLYDRLRSGDIGGVRAHLGASLEYQRRLARFLENHDEPRAAAVFPADRHRAAAALTFFAPGLKFFHEGQWEGRHRSAIIQLCRRPDEVADRDLSAFYERLVAALREVMSGAVEAGWQLLEAREAWAGNPTHLQFIGYCLHSASRTFVVAVNFAANRGQCYLPLPCAPGHGTVVLRDLLKPVEYTRDGASLTAPGLYLDVEPWRAHLFAVQPSG